MGGIRLVLLLGVYVIACGIARVVGVYHLEDNAVAGGQHGVVHLKDGGAALDQNGSLIGVEYGAVGDGEPAALVPEAHDSEPAGVHLGAPEYPGGRLVGHNKAVVRHVNAAVLKGVHTVPNGEGTVAAGAGNGHIAVFQIQPTAAHPVGGHDTPALGGDGAVLIPGIGEVGQVGGPAVAPQAQHPGHPAHISGHHVVLIIRGKHPVPGGNLAIPHIQPAVASGKDRAPGGALGGDIGVLHGQHRLVPGHDSGAVADKVVSSVALEGHIGPGDGVGALAAYHNAVKVLVL